MLALLLSGMSNGQVPVEDDEFSWRKSVTEARTVHVRALDPKGEPVAGAEIAVCTLSGIRKPVTGTRVALAESWKIVAATTDASGTGTVTIKQPARTQVAVGAPPDWHYSFSEIVASSTDIELTLVPIPAERVVAGAVLGPDGQPYPGAEVEWNWTSPETNGTDRSITDHAGRFVFINEQPECSGTLVATHVESELQRAVAFGIESGTKKLELRLTEPGSATLAIFGSDGMRLPFADVDVLTETDGKRRSLGEYKAKPGETIRFTLPYKPYYLDVRASWHQRETFGPFDPESISRHIALSLKPTPQIRGRVLHAGLPVERTGVSVSFESPYLSPYGGHRSTKEYRGRFIETDEDGRFRVAIKAPGDYFIRASHVLHGEAQLGPLSLDSANLPWNLVLDDWLAPGEIRGKVIAPTGHEARDLLVTCARGFGLVQLEPDDTYRLIGLPPGEHRVSVMGGGTFFSDFDFGFPPSSWFQMRHGPAGPPDWVAPNPTFTATVRSGETTRLDLDLTKPQACVLEGAVLVDDAAPTARPDGRMWSGSRTQQVVLIESSGARVSSCNLDEEGRFTLWAERAGSYQLQISVPLHGHERLMVDEPVELRRGVIHWQRNLSTD